MFRTLFILILIVAIIVGAPFLADNQGYVLIRLGSYEAHTSVVFLAILALLFLFFLAFLEKIIKFFYSYTFGLKNKVTKYQKNSALNLTRKGFLKLYEGNFKDGEKYISKGCSHSETPILDLLTAFDISLKHLNFTEARYYLDKAKLLANKDIDLALDISELRYVVALQEWEKASKHIDIIKSKHSLKKHNELSVISLEVYSHTKEWEKLEKALNLATKSSLIKTEQSKTIQQSIEVGLVEANTQDKTAEQIFAWWKSSPRRFRKTALVKLEVLDRLIALGDNVQATSVATALVSDHNYEELLRIKAFDTIRLIRLVDIKNKLMTKLIALEAKYASVSLQSCLAFLYYGAKEYEKSIIELNKFIKTDKANLAEYCLSTLVFSKLHDGKSIVGLNQPLEHKVYGHLTVSTDNAEGTLADANEAKQSQSEAGNDNSGQKQNPKQNQKQEYKGEPNPEEQDPHDKK